WTPDLRPPPPVRPAAAIARDCALPLFPFSLVPALTGQLQCQAVHQDLIAPPVYAVYLCSVFCTVCAGVFLAATPTHVPVCTQHSTYQRNRKAHEFETLSYPTSTNKMY
ncbi:hypothetical protein Taro_001425, partial [Colocasia esculenta]|nr:hypothetical protein [Colocasia esculenta]